VFFQDRPRKGVFNESEVSKGGVVSEAEIWEIVLKVATLVGSLATIILGTLAIWLSLYFYKRGNELYTAMTQALARIEASTKTTEVASTEVTKRLVEGVLASFQKSTLRDAEQPTILRISEKLTEALGSLSPKKREAASRGVKEEVGALFRLLRAEVAPSSLEYDWGPFIRRMDELEQENKFLSVKWLNEKVFAEDPVMKEALQVAIRDGILETYPIPNPRSLEHPTTACRLDRKNPAVVRTLSS
jgi:hypothetical protein